MKLRYYTYCLQNINDPDEKCRINLKEFFRAYSNFSTPAFKNQFLYFGDNVYLIHLFGDTYFFVSTRDSNLIKKIKTTNMQLSAIQDILANDENVGFSSFVHFKDDFFGFATTTYAPKLDAFIFFTNQLLNNIGLSSWGLLVNPLTQKISREEVLNLQFMGQTKICIPHTSCLKEQLSGLFGGSDGSENFDELESIEIIFKPKLRKNIRSHVQPLLASLPDNDSATIILKAKMDEQSILTEYYLDQSSAVFDIIDPNRNLTIDTQICERIQSNHILEQVLRHHREMLNEQNITDSHSAVADFYHESAWLPLSDNILVDN